MVGPRDSHISILLSTYNGARWLPPLIESIRAQTHADWSLSVRDDGSTDGTMDLLAHMAASDDRVRIVADGAGNLGPAESFMTLLAEVRSGLFAFCDQDDVWLPDKLERSVAALASDPIAAVYTDAIITTADGSEIHPSAFAVHGVPANGQVPFGQLLINNAAIGATMVGTAELARRAIAQRDGRPVLMHDWWVALVAAHQGSLRGLPVATLLWRRHPATVTGSRPRGIGGRAARRREYLDWSITAAETLTVHAASSAAAGLAAQELAKSAGRDPTIRAMVRAWRQAGVRAWTLRAEAALLLALAWPFGRP